VLKKLKWCRAKGQKKSEILLINLMHHWNAIKIIFKELKHYYSGKEK
jgi:hypothetical protein